jgi:hypothetical protein
VKRAVGAHKTQLMDTYFSCRIFIRLNATNYYVFSIFLKIYFKEIYGKQENPSY